MCSQSPFIRVKARKAAVRKILLVEDDEEIQYVNQIILERRGYDVRLAMSLAEARAQITEDEPDIIVLDIVLPDGSGLDFLKELRVDKNIPILLLTALGTSNDVVAGLAAGGDDYLAKPYNNDEFLERVKAMLRRAERVPKTIQKGALTLKVNSNQAFANGEDLGLSRLDFHLILLMAQNEGKVLSADTIYEEVWGQPMVGDSQAVRVAISRLRKKIAPAGYDISIIRNEGYVFGKL